jgi:signal transduction histidine kinase
MSEVRATVAVLRGGDGPEERAPAPGLAQLATLVEAVRGDGVRVHLDVPEVAGSLPEVVELTAYRVVQEALTNVVRHADARRAWVEVRPADAEVFVEVRDDGPGRGRPSPAGFGLRGMSERVASLGGEVHHGRHPEGGWVVRARIPLDGVPA